MRNARLIQLVALLCMLGLAAAAASRISTVNEGRKKLNTLGSTSPQENAPPEYAFFIQAFGAFRGLIVDIAFIRAETFKEQGRFFDAVQLAKWICALQPHFPTVWEFAAWNLSWNISVTTYTPEERWNWVYAGVKLLRDQGIPYNKRAVNLYKQIAWTFNNKMGENIDDFHYAYKTNWAWRMHLLLGPPPAPLAEVDPNTLAAQSSPEQERNLLAEAARQTFLQNEEKRRQEAEKRGERYTPRTYEEVTRTAAVPALTVSTYELARQASLQELRRIHEAPRRLAELYAQFPPARDMVYRLRELGIVLNDDELTEDEYWRTGGLAFTFFAPYRRLVEPVTTLRTVLDQDPNADTERVQAEKLDAILGIRAGNPAGQALVRWLQKKVLAEVYKLETEYMLEVVQNFGPVDWRSVDAHSLYWVVRGLVAGGETVTDFYNDKTNTARIMFFSLRNLFLRNRMVFEPYPPKIHLSYLNFGRDLNFIEPMHQAYIRYGPLLDPRGGPGAGNLYRIGHTNFLTEAIRMLYLSGREAEADHYYKYLQETYPTNEEGEPNPALAKTLHDYVMDSFVESIQTAGVREIRIALHGLFTSAFNELAAGDADRYLRIVQRCQELYEQYMKDKRTPLMEGKTLFSFTEEQADALYNWFAQQALNPLMTLHKIRLWRALPLYLRQAVYDDLVERYFRPECEAWEFDLARAFPEPPGMEEYRRLHPSRRKPDRSEEVETLPMRLGD